MDFIAVCGLSSKYCTFTLIIKERVHWPKVEKVHAKNED